MVKTQEIITRAESALAKSRPADIADRIMLFPILLERLKEHERRKATLLDELLTKHQA